MRERSVYQFPNLTKSINSQMFTTAAFIKLWQSVVKDMQQIFS